MNENKVYTLEEAYSEILRIKNEMGFQEFQNKEQQRAYERGYQQAVIDLTTDFSNRSNLFLAINTTKHEY
jgi:hypothetical protein